MKDNPIVFVITPFSEDFLALYDKLKEEFKQTFTFTNAGDLDSQQSIIKDIVQGIHKADVVIADLTDLNANVFYELGLAHAMNKKVIIITQNLDELPFDIRSYRANEYSLKFNKLPELIEKIKGLLFGAIDGSVEFGNPVRDYIPNFYKVESNEHLQDTQGLTVNQCDNESVKEIISEGEAGFLDYVEDIKESSEKITNEILSIVNEMDEMNTSIKSATNEINRVKAESGSVNASFARSVCRKLSEPIDKFSIKLKGHVSEVPRYWAVVENGYLSLLDNNFSKNINNIQSLSDSMDVMKHMQDDIRNSDKSIESFVVVLRTCLGMERKLNKSISSLIFELEEYLKLTNTMSSSIDRIISKGNVVTDSIRASMALPSVPNCD